ncbi:DUF2239 family protein [Limnohabitans sp. Rim8]|uniref:DUF2239 family protein n=1 Tax=Limnohabitans sp. Rim8 TaxID=1100718 RepID=UPI0033063022
MNLPLQTEFVAFEGSFCLTQGALSEVALQVKAATEARPLAHFMVFNANTSEIVDFDLRGTSQEVLARLGLRNPASQALKPSAQPIPLTDAVSSKVGPGRPKLGVVAREVTLLPRHWAWLASQPGGASVALRKLVEQAQRECPAQDLRRLSQESAYRFMSAMAGSLEGFEEAARALFAADRERFDALIAPWPQDIQAHLKRVAQVALTPLEKLTNQELPRA